MTGYTSRKFLLACVFTASGTAGFFMGLMGGGEYIALATLVLGVYATADVVQDKHREDRAK